MPTTTGAGPTLGIFASDRGPGDPERMSLMTQAGTLFARRGARLLCLSEKGATPLPLLTAARTAGGTVSLLADEIPSLPPTMSDISVEVVSDRSARHAQLADASQVLVALPGSLASVTALFGAWASTRTKPKPVVMLNRHNAFEVVRGFAGDVLSHAVAGYDRNVQFADSVEDLWNKITWVLEQRR